VAADREAKAKAHSISSAILGALLVFYPVVVFLCLVVFKLPPRDLSPFIILFGIAYLVLNKDNIRGRHGWTVFICPAILLTLGILCLVLNSKLALKLYPVLADMAYFFIFGSSYFVPPTMVYQYGAMFDKKINERLPAEEMAAFCKKLTIPWCVYFIIDCSIAVWTLYLESDLIWGFWNAGLTYIIMALIVIVEVLIYGRYCVKKR
jgi:uncharacterized membrane protein